MIAGSWGRAERLLPIQRSEFGPLDALSDQAHDLYAAGQLDEALLYCYALLGPVEASGDLTTAWYLRYVRCLVHEQRCDWERLQDCGTELLGVLGNGSDPCWRAKALSVLSHSRLNLGRPIQALELLAEAYRLATDHRAHAYNQASACHVLSSPLCSFLLFDPAMSLLDLALRSLRERPTGTLLVLLEQIRVGGTWGMMLELLGESEGAELQYARCLSTALRAGRLADRPGTEPRQRQVALGLREFAHERLTRAPADPDLLRECALSAVGDSEPLIGLAHVSQLVRHGDEAAAQDLAEQIRERAARTNQPVPQWVATAWLARFQERRHGTTPSTGAWESVAVESLSRLWKDRSVRFEYLLHHRRTQDLRARVERDDHRLFQDPLTGVGNRRRLDAALSTPAASRTVAFVDVDHFKQVNDHFGHEVGDEVLRRLAGLLHSLCRPADLLSRYGGDEFVIVFEADPTTGPRSGPDPWDFPERLRRAVAAQEWEKIAPGLVIEVSVGTAAEGPDVLRRADRALLTAKAHRDRAVPIMGR
ncbi:MAG: hypothetical protein QG608_1742 [Actinomycetota bacterium]|nr:hypothetical protein [Actinomycetota bacterium]